ncbi:unnamed protein product [Urochloa humidicola]
MAPPAGEVLTLSDDLLAAILILLPTLADLGRACATCSAFRRVITSAPFLRRLHALHPPALLGFRTYYGNFKPVDTPHSSAAAGRALARAADFRFSFLPNLGFWVLRDARGGRFLVDYDESANGIFTKLAVCDPLFRRYVILPPIPEGLAASVQQPLSRGHRLSRFPLTRRISDVFLAPPCDEEAAADAASQPQPFRVIWMAQCETKLFVFVFSSASSQWRATACPSWRDLDPKMPALIYSGCLRPGGYAHGCFYWCISNFLPVFKLLVLDMSTMEFSTINPLPVPAYKFIEFAIVELGESKRAMFLLAERYGDVVLNDGHVVLQCYCANGQSHGEDASQWVLENEVPLRHPHLFNPHMIGDADGTILLQGRKDDGCSEDFCCMSFDFKTLQLQMIRETLVGGVGERAMPTLYTGYPLSLSSPTI